MVEATELALEFSSFTMISMCSQSAPHCSMNFASDARFAKSDDSIEGAILGCGSIRCNSSSFPPAMVDQSIDRSIDRWISSSFDPHLLVSQTQKKRKILPRMAGFFKNPWLQKILWSENLLVQKNLWSETSERWFLQKKTLLLARFQNNFSSSWRIFFVFFFLVAAVAGGIPLRDKRLGIFWPKNLPKQIGRGFFSFLFFFGFFLGGFFFFLILFCVGLSFFLFSFFSPWVS